MMLFNDALEMCLDLIDAPSIILNTDLNIINFNRLFFSTFNINNSIAKGSSIFEINENQWDIPSFRKVLLEILPRKEFIRSYRITHKFKRLGAKALEMDINKFRIKEGGTEYYLLKITDISSKLENERRFTIIDKGMEVLERISFIFNNFQFYEIFKRINDLIIELFDCENSIFGYINENGDMVICFEKRRLEYSAQFLRKKLGEEFYRIKTFPHKTTLTLPEETISIESYALIPIFYGQKQIGCFILINNLLDIDEIKMNILRTITSYISPFLYNLLQKKHFKKPAKSHDGISEIDEVDRQLLSELFKDGSQTLHDLSKKIIKPDGDTMSSTGIKKRLTKLKRERQLKIQGNINLKKFSFKLAFYFITLEKFQESDNFLHMVEQKCPKVIMSGRIIGKHQLFLCMIGTSLEKIDQNFNKCELINNTPIKDITSYYVINLNSPRYLPADIFAGKRRVEKNN